MKMTRWFGLFLVATWLMATSAQAQQGAYRAPYPPPSPVQNGVPEIPSEAFTAHHGGLSDWIVYKQNCCEGRHGRVTPLSTELYFQAGPSIPFGGQTLSRELVTGWTIGGGARALFFNEPYTRAWVVDAHIINTNQTSANTGNQFPLVIFRSGNVETFGANGVPGATVQASNRTMVGLGFGREWYPWQAADVDGRKWRLGADAGGRYGSHILNLNETRHIKDVVGSAYIGAHTNLECPWRQVIFQVGARAEWCYTWSDVLQQTSDVQEISILFSAGVRY